MQIKDFIKIHQQVIVLIIGYLLVAILAFGLGRFTAFKYQVPEIRVEQVFEVPTNYSPNISSTQTESVINRVQTTANCEGKIKGSSSMIYHLPGGSFYNRTTKPIRCFDTEAEAQKAGFRKSAR